MPTLPAIATQERNSVAYDDLMAKNTTSQDRNRADLIALAEEQRTFPERRREAVTRARSGEAPMTWREIAALLGMTEAGLRKAVLPLDTTPSEPSQS